MRNFFKKKNEEIFESAENGLGVSPLGEEEMHAKEKEIKGLLRIREESNRWISLGVLTGYLSIAILVTPLLSYGATLLEHSEVWYDYPNYSATKIAYMSVDCDLLGGDSYITEYSAGVTKYTGTPVTAVCFGGICSGTQTITDTGYPPATTTFTFSSPYPHCQAGATTTMWFKVSGGEIWRMGAERTKAGMKCANESATACPASNAIHGKWIGELGTYSTNSTTTATTTVNSTTTEYVLLDEGLSTQIDTMFGLFLALGVIYVMWASFNMMFRFMYQKTND